MTSVGPKKPGALRRLSEKNINFARSVGRRLSTMLNLPVGYDMKDSNMMDSIPEIEPSPPTNRRDSVTVRPKDNDDVTFVSVYSNDKHMTCDSCKLRRRLVDSGVQTADVTDATNHPSDIRQKKNPFSFITSISIKSGISKTPSKRSGFANPAFQSKSFDHNQVKTRYPQLGGYDDKVLAYGADDIPRNRSSSARSVPDQPRARTPPLDYDQESPLSIERDISFNDGSILNGDEKFSKGRLDGNPFQNLRTETRSNLSDGQNSTVVQIGRVESDVSNANNGRVTPVEDYYEPIEIVKKSKTLSRQHSTHV